MTADTWIALLTPIFVAVAAILQNMRAGKIKAKLEENTEQTIANGQASVLNSAKLDQVHVLVNGRVLALLTELSQAYKELAIYKGTAAGDLALKVAQANVDRESSRTQPPHP